MLTSFEIRGFLNDGFVRIDDAFPCALAQEGRDILWREMGLNPNEPHAWTEPVIRLWFHGEPPFVQAANTRRLHAAYDALVGPGRWAAPTGLGTWPIRFPSARTAGDDGWHVDASFPPAGGDANDFMAYHVNVASKGRALLMLFLFSDVGNEDAPTRILTGSHKVIARQLEPFGEMGARITDLDYPADSPVALATGPAGTVYLCHPLLVHAAQAHRGTTPKFMAQPPLYPTAPFRIIGPTDDLAPVEIAIREALGS